MKLLTSGYLSGVWLLLCCALGNLPKVEAGAAGAVIAIAKPLAQVLLNGITTAAKSGIVTKTISYGTAGALAGAGDAAGDYISAKVQANNNLELAKMQQQYIKELQVAIPVKPSVTITDVTHEQPKQPIPNNLHSLLIQLINSTIPQQPATVPIPQRPTDLKQEISQDPEKVFFFYYIIVSVSVCTMFVFCGCCLCCFKFLFSDKLAKDFKVKFLNHV